jgi:hypothetical protein
MQMDNAMTREFMRIEHENTVKKEPLYAERGESLRCVEAFWATALSNSDVSAYMSEEDQALLQYLDSVRARACHTNPVLCLLQLAELFHTALL